MTKEIRINIKTSFGEVEISGESKEEVLDLLQTLSPDFFMKMNSKIAHLFTESPFENLRGVVEMSMDGPLIIAKNDLTHYESIGLILYCFRNNQCSIETLRNLLQSSGKRVTIPARLNEMTKKGYIFKPDPKKPEIKLSTNGIRWLEEEVLSKLTEESRNR